MKLISVRIPVAYFEKIRKFCEKHNMTQSEFIRYAINQTLRY